MTTIARKHNDRDGLEGLLKWFIELEQVARSGDDTEVLKRIAEAVKSLKWQIAETNAGRGVRFEI